METFLKIMQAIDHFFLKLTVVILVIAVILMGRELWLVEAKVFRFENAIKEVQQVMNLQTDHLKALESDQGILFANDTLIKETFLQISKVLSEIGK